MKTKLILLATLFHLCSINISGQESNIRRVDVNRITDSFLTFLSKSYCGKTTLPYTLAGNKTLTDYRYTVHSCAQERIDKRLPLYAGTDKRIEDSEQTIRAGFYDTNGDYIILLAEALSGDHNDFKHLLITYSLDGKVIDYLTFYKRASIAGGWTNTIEGSLHKDLKVNIYTLNLNEYPVDKEGSVKSNLHGQRIDRQYQITPEGKFKLLKETKYKPQNYPPSVFNESISIIDRKETPLPQ